MISLRQLLQAIARATEALIERVLAFVCSPARALRRRRRQTLRNELEAERLDRIRNPSKYLGKK
jgi:hypothetical protein